MLIIYAATDSIPSWTVNRLKATCGSEEHKKCPGHRWPELSRVARLATRSYATGTKTPRRPFGAVITVGFRFAWIRARAASMYRRSSTLRLYEL